MAERYSKLAPESLTNSIIGIEMLHHVNKNKEQIQSNNIKFKYQTFKQWLPKMINKIK